ncbi:GNAT family N-acetyltransferase [Streptomyces sp. CA-243310]|uniref:GNAT family N-acetyltransferase n=1 Tax=Streptomyces sp. CA-243310 TaxID=3240056 RepID=UPI003D89EC62
MPARWAEDRDYTFGAFRKDTGALVGSYCLTLVSLGVRELGYWAVKEQRGRGYSVEAARSLCDWGWAILGVHRIEWWAMTGNTGSRAVAERLGFTVEGGGEPGRDCAAPLRRRHLAGRQAGIERDV